MPKNLAGIWAQTIALIIGYPLVSLIYYPLQVETWTPEQRLQGDTVGIPMFGSLIATVVLSPLIIGSVHLCVRRYSSENRLLAWRPDRPVRSWIATIILGGFSLTIAFVSLLLASEAKYWFDGLWVGYFALWSFMLLQLRSAYVTQISLKEWNEIWAY